MSPPTVDVHFVLLDGSLILDWAGPAEALRIANQIRCAQGHAPAFELHFISPARQTTSSVGAVIADLAPLPDLARASRPQWVVLVGQPGDRMTLDSEPAHDLLHWLRGLRLAPPRPARQARRRAPLNTSVECAPELGQAAAGGLAFQHVLG
ncbi:MAG: hypothetical protein PHQ87_10545, partial [Hydrogenophaga sp.]|nr:hypothetical protein [Hydrogenophaga sp.]